MLLSCDEEETELREADEGGANTNSLSGGPNPICVSNWSVESALSSPKESF